MFPLFCIVFFPGYSEAVAGTRPDSVEDSARSALSFEILGKGLLGSLDFDYLVFEKVGIGIGISYIPSFDTHDLPAMTIVPLYGTYSIYSALLKHRAQLIGGIDLLSRSYVSLPDSEEYATVAPFVGLGYEYRQLNGFLFRFTGYLAALPGWGILP